MKKLGLFLCVVTLLLLLSLSTAVAQPIQALPTAAAVYVNGERVFFEAYNIAGYNYFKLRDLAFALSGTDKQFAGIWEAAANAISLMSGQPYQPLGGEMSGKGSGTAEVQLAQVAVTLDGQPLTLTAYNIGGNNYFKLRDLGQALDFAVFWQAAVSRIAIDTSLPYTEDQVAASSPAPDSPAAAAPAEFNAVEFAAEVIRLLNEQRAAEGLKPLSADSSLMEAAQLRAAELTMDFSHDRPDGRSCFSVLAEFDVSYSSAGENIASGQSSPQRVMDSWMGSAGHRANILGSFTKIGVGVVKTPSGYRWVQLFVF